MASAYATCTIYFDTNNNAAPLTLDLDKQQATALQQCLFDIQTLKDMRTERFLREHDEPTCVAAHVAIRRIKTCLAKCWKESERGIVKRVIGNLNAQTNKLAVVFMPRYTNEPN
jgi:hypothetical protein